MESKRSENIKLKAPKTAPYFVKMLLCIAKFYTSSISPVTVAEGQI